MANPELEVIDTLYPDTTTENYIDNPITSFYIMSADTNSVIITYHRKLINLDPAEEFTITLESEDGTIQYDSGTGYNEPWNGKTWKAKNLEPNTTYNIVLSGSYTDSFYITTEEPSGTAKGQQNIRMGSSFLLNSKIGSGNLAKIIVGSETIYNAAAYEIEIEEIDGALRIYKAPRNAVTQTNSTLRIE